VILSLHTDRLEPRAEARLPGCNRVLYLREGDAVALEDPGGYLMRCDRVDFPPGGIAWTHVHQGPGIRCLLAGAFRVEVNGKRHDIEPGGAWFEAGPDPVLASASKSAAAAFVRVMILPRALRGKSSIRYVKPEDAGKPRLQTYRMFVDEFIDLPR
jgi:quercetin dioxygenase-like cupin family protein